MGEEGNRTVVTITGSSYSPVGALLYGRRSIGSRLSLPVTYRALQIPRDVLDHILTDDMFWCPMDDLARHGFERCVDMPHL